MNMSSRNRLRLALAVIAICPVASYAATLIDGSGIRVTDQVHPTEAGATKMANKWFATLATLLE